MIRQRLASIHRGVALILFNTILLFLGVNGLIWVYELIRPPSSASTSVPHQRMTLPVHQMGALKYGLNRLRQVYPGRSDEEIIRLVLESWNVPLVCDAETFYTEDVFDGYYINVAEAKFRRVGHQGPWPPDRNAFNIFVFGGSTTFGYGVPDEQTLPSTLQAKVRQAVGRTDIFVYNFGHSFFFSLQEAMAFKALVRDGLAPHLAIFIDGLNEFYHWDGQPTLRPCRNPRAIQEKVRRSLICREEELCWPLHRLISRARVLRNPDQTVSDLPSKKAPPMDDAIANQAVIDRWLANKHDIERVAAAAQNTKTLFVRQPVPTYAYNFSSHLFPDDLDQHLRSKWGYEMWEKMEGDNPQKSSPGNFLDLAHLGEQKSVPLYVDAVHYTSEFTEEIATALAQALLERNLIPPPWGNRAPL